ncbi:general secretion pathway protein GspB [Celerinatantimonas sp. YJH-8]|uniref:general secretion pathway protein GspB n=1 Tax=Celerinatantimonas sp. YJH-8 TaxID=3228714 RepID=UPI0038CAE597
MTSCSLSSVLTLTLVTSVLGAGAGFGGFWAKSHWADAIVISPPVATVQAPVLDPLPKLSVQSVDLIAQVKALQPTPDTQPSRPAQAAIVKPSTSTQPPLPVAEKVAPGVLSDTSSETTQAHSLAEVGQDQPPLLSELPASQVAGLPPLIYSAHVYSSDPKRSYIQLNQQILHQGDQYAGLTVVMIRYPDTIFRYRGQLVRQPALVDWK